MLFFIVKFMFLFLLLNGCVKNNDNSSTSGSSNTHKSSGNKNTNSGDTTEEVKPNTGDSAKEAQEEAAKLTENLKKFDEILEKNKQTAPESSKKNKKTSKFNDDPTNTEITLDFKKLTAEAKSAKLAKEEVEKKAKEEAAKLAQEEAKSKDGIIKQIDTNGDKDKLAKNITEFLNNNPSENDIKEITNILATKEASYIKDVNTKLTENHRQKIRPHLKDALTKAKSEFKADVILDLGILNFTNSEKESLKNNTGYVASVDYTKTTFGDMLINKRIKDTLDNFNEQLKNKYNSFRDSCKVEDKSEQYNKERFYHLLRSEKIGDNYFINRLVNLPASDASYSMLKDLLDNTENPKEFLSSTQYLLLSLTKDRKFTPFKEQTTYLAEDNDKKIEMIKLLLEKGGLSLIKDQNSFDNLLPIIKDNKLNIDDVITSSTEKELENFATIFAKADYSNESNATAANNLLNKILENKNITTQIKNNILVNLLLNNNKKFIDKMLASLINDNALIDGVNNNKNIALLSGYLVAKNDLINLIKDNKNKKTQVELLNYLSANDANNNLDLFENLLQNTNFTADELKNSLSNLCNEKWHKKINYNTQYAYNNQKRIELIKNLILTNAEIPKNIADEDVKNILESSKENKQILEKLFKNDKFLDKFLSYTTDTLKTDASYEALKSNIINASKFLNKVISSKSIDVNKSDELFGLLLENGANLNNISNNTIFENKLTLVPDNKMTVVLSSLINNDKIKIAVKYAVENLKDDFRDGLLELTNKSNVARNAVIDTALNKNINELVDLINNPENYGLAKEQITKNDYALSNIKFEAYSEAYNPINSNGNLLMHLFPKIIKDKESIKNIVLALKEYFNKEEWLKYLLETDYESNSQENDKYNFMRFMRGEVFKNVNEYYELIDFIGVSNEDFTQQDKYKLYKLLSEFDEKNANKSMNLFYDFYFNTFLFLNKTGIKNMEEYIKENIPSDSDNKLNNALKKFDEAYFKMFKWE